LKGLSIRGDSILDEAFSFSKHIPNLKRAKGADSDRQICAGSASLLSFLAEESICMLTCHSPYSLHKSLGIVIVMLCLLPNFARGDIPYDVRFTGVEERELRERLNEASGTFRLRSTPPETVAALRQRAEADIPELTQILRSYAYYNARIHLDYRQQANRTVVLFDIDLGPLYPLKAFEINVAEQLELFEEEWPAVDNDSLLDFIQVTHEDLGVELGEAATAETILCAEAELIDFLQRGSYPLAGIEQRQVLVDQADQTVIVRLYLSPGPRLYFGPAVFRGLESVYEDWVQMRIYWEEGEPFDPCLVEEAQRSLEATGVFSMVSITPGEVDLEQRRLPMVIEVDEANHRTVGAGINYSTQEGPGFTAEWEIRNFRGRGERVSLNADVNTSNQDARWIYRKPDFLVRKQEAVLKAEARYQETEGYTERSLSASSLIERIVHDCLEYSYGVEFKYLDVSDSDNNADPFLFKVPVRIRWSDVDCKLDPCYGRTFLFGATPTQGINTGRINYVVTSLDSMVYWPILDSSRYVFAQKLSLGSIFGADRIDIPPPDRFYAGTDSLLRGYNYLTVSPLDDSNRPIGGRSLIVYTGELRAKASDSMSLVGFFEIGNVYSGVVPGFAERLRRSVGAGVRYHTPVGPLRLDVAFPLDRRAEVDDDFQIYVSIGQAF
jgi:translocation and assembly module TamA